MIQAASDNVQCWQNRILPVMKLFKESTKVENESIAFLKLDWGWVMNSSIKLGYSQHRLCQVAAAAGLCSGDRSFASTVSFRSRFTLGCPRWNWRDARRILPKSSPAGAYARWEPTTLSGALLLLLFVVLYRSFSQSAQQPSVRFPQPQLAYT